MTHSQSLLVVGLLVPLAGMVLIAVCCCKLAVTSSHGCVGGGDGCFWCQLVWNVCSRWWVIVRVDPWNDGSWWSLSFGVVWGWYSILLLLVGHVGFGVAVSMVAGPVWLFMARIVSVVVAAVGDAREIGGAIHHCFPV